MVNNSKSIVHNLLWILAIIEWYAYFLLWYCCQREGYTVSHFSHSSKIVVKCIKIILMHSCFVFYFHKQVKHIIDSCCVVGKVRFCIWPQVLCCFVYLHISIKCMERNARQIPMQIRFSQRHVIWWANNET